jgi:hypothetical protein
MARHRPSTGRRNAVGNIRGNTSLHPPRGASSGSTEVSKGLMLYTTAADTAPDQPRALEPERATKSLRAGGPGPRGPLRLACAVALISAPGDGPSRLRDHTSRTAARSTERCLRTAVAQLGTDLARAAAAHPNPRGHRVLPTALRQQPAIRQVRRHVTQLPHRLISRHELLHAHSVPAQVLRQLDNRLRRPSTPDPENRCRWGWWCC